MDRGVVVETVRGDGCFHSVVEVGHDLGNAFVVVSWEHDVGDDVNVAFADPGEGSFDTAIEVVDVETVDANSTLLFPQVCVTIAIKLGTGVVVSLAWVNCEKRIVK